MTKVANDDVLPTCTPGFYALNYRALRIREMVRMFGLVQLPVAYFSIRSLPPAHPAWMPGLSDETKCRKEDLSEDFWRFTETHRQDFERLGFTVTNFDKVTRHVSSVYGDNGGVVYFDETRSIIGNILYSTTHATPPFKPLVVIVIGFRVVYRQGSLTYTNNKHAFNPPRFHVVRRVKSANAELMYHQLLHEASRRAEQPRRFPDDNSFNLWFDELQKVTFEERVKRKLFIRLTDEEVEEARRKLLPPTVS